MIPLSWEAIVLLGTVLGGLAFACITAIVARLSSEEVSGWLPVWSAQLLESAVEIIPAEHRDRYRQEWRAELAAFHGRRLSGLRFALRLRRRARSTHDALQEGQGPSEVFEPEAPPADVRPLDPEAIAAIVRRAVDKTRPGDHRSGEDFIEALIQSLAGLEIGDLPAEITDRYLSDLLDWRTREGYERALKSLQVFDFVSSPKSKSKSPLEIAREVARRQRASELRRRSNPRRRFPFSFWL